MGTPGVAGGTATGAGAGGGATTAAAAGAMAGAATAAAGSSGSNTGGEGAKEGQPILNLLLRSELLGVDASSPKEASERDRAGGDYSGAGAALPARNVLRFMSSSSGGYGGANGSAPYYGGSGGGGGSGGAFNFSSGGAEENLDRISRPFSLSPVGGTSQRLLAAPRKAKRKIAKVPFKVLDAPALADDFYLNLVDWSSLNVLAVGLGSCVYLWSACTSKVTKLCDLGPEDCVTSVSWTQRGTHLAVGTNLGEAQLWEVSRCKKVRTMTGHSARIGTLSWNGPILASGSRDRAIYLRDVRAREVRLEKETRAR